LTMVAVKDTTNLCLRCGRRPPARGYAIVDVVVEDAGGRRIPVPVVCGSCWEVMIQPPHSWHIVVPKPETGEWMGHYVRGYAVTPARARTELP